MILPNFNPRNFKAHNLPNAFMLNSILLAFITIFGNRLQQFEHTKTNKTFCLIITILYAIITIITFALYTRHRNSKCTSKEKAARMSCMEGFIPFFTAIICLICLILYFTAFDETDQVPDDAEKAANTTVAFFTTILLAMFVYIIMYLLFNFGPSLMLNERVK